MSSQQSASKDNLSLLLPYYLDKTFSEMFLHIGFEVFWADNRADTERVIIENEPDLALEWRHGDDDFPIRDLLRKHGRPTPVFLALNWGGPLPDNPGEIGCTGYIDFPFKMRELMDLFYKALPERKRPLVKKMCDSLNTDLLKLNTAGNATCKTILVVDHEDRILEVNGKVLEHIGYEVLLALSCPEAIDIYKKHKKRISAVVTALVMPGMNGIELIEWLHGQDPSLPIILTSGYEPGLKEFSQSPIGQSPLVATIEMPFSVTEISECLKEVLNVDFYIDDNGVRYVGKFKNGLPNGQGTLIFPEGGGYIGQFKNGVFDGEGTLTSADGNEYSGQWENGVLLSQRLESDAYRHSETGFVFPEKLAGMERGDVANYEVTQPGLGISVGYNIGEVNSTIYIYDLGLSNIPDGVDSDIFRNHFNEIIGEIFEAYKRGLYDSVLKSSEGETLLGNSLRNLEILSSSLVISQYGVKRISHIYLGVYNKYFLKIRFSYNESTKIEGDKRLQLFLNEIGNFL